METWVLAVVFVAALVGIFLTKTPGFGRYTTSALILVLVLFVGALFSLVGKVDSSAFINLLFAVAGYGGGLITGGRTGNTQTDDASR